MARPRKEASPCTGHNINLCEENRLVVMQVKAEKELEKKRTYTIDEAVNEIVRRYREGKK